MDFHCRCISSECYCTEEVFLTEEEQNEIILARIMGDALEHDIVSYKVCASCSDGWHLTDPNSEERSQETPEESVNDEG